MKTLFRLTQPTGMLQPTIATRGIFRRVYFIGRGPHPNDASHDLNFDLPAYQSYNSRAPCIHLFQAHIGRIIRYHSCRVSRTQRSSAFLVLLPLPDRRSCPKLARQLGKLMGEFRRASNEFRMQMEDELRIAEQADQQKKIAAMQAAAPVTPALAETTAETSAETAPPATGESSDEIMHENTIAPPYGESHGESFGESFDDFQPLPAPTPEPLPIATSGDVNLMPPATGLPEPRSAIAPVLDSIPHTPDPEQSTEQSEDHPSMRPPTMAK